MSPGRQLMVSPYFILKKTYDLFLVIALWKVMTFLAVVSSILPFFHVVCPVFFLNSATKNNFILVSPLDGVTGGSPPRTSY